MTGEWASDRPDWPDIEKLLIEILGDLATAAPETPADPSGTYGWLPYLQVTCIGGDDDGVTSRPRFAVDAFAGTKEASALLAGSARQRLLNFPHATVSGVLDRVSCLVQPRELPYGDRTKVRRYSASYSGALRRN